MPVAATDLVRFLVRFLDDAKHGVGVEGQRRLEGLREGHEGVEQGLD